MSTWLPFVLLLLAGFLVGGAWTLRSTVPRVAVGAAVAAVLALGGAVLRLV